MPTYSTCRHQQIQKQASSPSSPCSETHTYIHTHTNTASSFRNYFCDIFHSYYTIRSYMKGSKDAEEKTRGCDNSLLLHLKGGIIRCLCEETRVHKNQQVYARFSGDICSSLAWIINTHLWVRQLQAPQMHSSSHYFFFSSK